MTTPKDIICNCGALRPPTQEEDDWLQKRVLNWRAEMPPGTKEFDGIGELNFAFYVGNYITKIWWRNENWQCRIYFIEGSPFSCDHDLSLSPSNTVPR